MIESSKPVKFVIGLFDGHGGPAASIFAKNHLPQFLQDYFATREVQDVKDTLRQAVLAFDKNLIQNLIGISGQEKSGTCALFLVKIGTELFIVNVGDSKAIISRDLASGIEDLVTPHRPDVQSEAKRIVEKGGHVYRSHNTGNPHKEGLYQLVNRNQKMPLRVFPSNLSVSRTLGDSSVKASHPSIIISDPQIVEITSDFRYILMASDGVFDTLSNSDLSSLVEKVIAEGTFRSVEEATDFAVSILFQQLIENYCYDNVSAVLITGSLLHCFLAN